MRSFHNKLIHVYVKCGSLLDARKVFDCMKERDIVSWNTIIAAYRSHGSPQEAVTLFHRMQQTGIQPDQFTFASVLPACAKMGDLEQIMDIHESIKDTEILSDVVVANVLLDMYTKCGSIGKSRELFDKLSKQDVISWNTMISGYANWGNMEEARKLFERMPQKDVVSWNAMIAGYAKCGSIVEAQKLFDRMPRRNVISWNAMISGYIQSEFFEKAIETFKQMKLARVKPDSTTFAIILPACAKMGALELGMDIHQSVKDRGMLSDIAVATALVDMYAKCGKLNEARELFDQMPQKDVISWTAMIGGYAQNGFVEKAIETFKKMQLAGIKPNSATFASILPAFAKVGALEQGMNIHQSIMEGGLLSDVIVGNSLVDMYAKCGSIDKARELFDRLSQRDVISWNSMIAGYVQNGFVENALGTFKQMRLAGVKPNSTTFASIFPACAKIGALKQGVEIHQSIKDRGILSDILVATSLVDMYAKCGSIERARELFDKMSQRNVVSWTAMIGGYAQNGFVEKALETFKKMQFTDVKPNSPTFACVLWACSHAGLLDEGCTIFNDMIKRYCITPKIDHYVCIIDLLARAGYLEDTLNFIIKMPVKPVVDLWMCFLGACRSHMNLGLGVFTAVLLFDLDPKTEATYVLLSNIYAEVGWWNEVQMVRRLMKDRGIKKVPGCSWIEGQKMVHAFCEETHPQT